jgi:hypothetical protein
MRFPFGKFELVLRGVIHVGGEIRVVVELIGKHQLVQAGILDVVIHHKQFIFLLATITRQLLLTAAGIGVLAAGTTPLSAAGLLMPFSSWSSRATSRKSSA